MQGNIERLAKEYKAALSGLQRESMTGDEPTVEQIIILEENQIDFLDRLIPRLTEPARKTANYIKNVAFRSASTLFSALSNDPYVPAFRNGNSPLSSLKNAITDTQINIFALLDKAGLNGETAEKIFSLENRKTGLIALLNTC